MISLKFCTGLIVALLCLQSCAKDEPNIPGTSHNNSTENSNSDTNQNETSVEGLIKDNVSVTNSYTDYCFTFTVKSKLKSKLPYSEVEYGIGHGSIYESTYINVSVGNQAYYYSSSINNGIETITFKNPFWFYYVFANQDKDKWTKCEMYYKSYISLKEKGYSRLSSEERELYGEITRYLDECQEEVKRYYKPILEICVDGKFYQVKSFQIP